MKMNKANVKQKAPDDSGAFRMYPALALPIKVVKNVVKPKFAFKKVR